MKIGLAALSFKTKDIPYNQNKMIETLKKYSAQADLLVFGESFLQGFQSLSWNYQIDEKIALSLDDEIIQSLRAACKEYGIGLSFGFLGKEKQEIFSGQLTIDDMGKVINLFKRVSIGWKETEADKDKRYVEDEGFHAFTYKGLDLAVGICGDFWYEENIQAINKLDKDLVLWPVYTDYNPKAWNETIKYEYAEQARLIGSKVFYVNSVCYDIQGEDVAKGGAVYFKTGQIEKELPSGSEGVLIVEV